MRNQKVIVTNYQTNIPTRMPYTFKRQFREGYISSRPQATYEVKGHYVYPKYVRPERKNRSKFEGIDTINSRLT